MLIMFYGNCSVQTIMSLFRSTPPPPSYLLSFLSYSPTLFSFRFICKVWYCVNWAETCGEIWNISGDYCPSISPTPIPKKIKQPLSLLPPTPSVLSALLPLLADSGRVSVEEQQCVLGMNVVSATSDPKNCWHGQQPKRALTECFC